MQLIILVRPGEIDPAERFLAGLNDQDREHGYIRIAEAALRLAQHDPSAAAAALSPVLHASDSVMPWIWLADAFLLEASVREALAWVRTGRQRNGQRLPAAVGATTASRVPAAVL
jgi:hypothetical protein